MRYETQRSSNKINKSSTFSDINWNLNIGESPSDTSKFKTRENNLLKKRERIEVDNAFLNKRLLKDTPI